VESMDPGRGESRIGAISAISGAFFLATGTYLHPSQANPNDATQAFAEYAADILWTWTHLTQFLGVVLMVGALVLLSRRMAFDTVLYEEVCAKEHGGRSHGVITV